MILGRDLQQALDMDILWSIGHLQWDGIQIPMYNTNSIDQKPFYLLYFPVPHIHLETLKKEIAWIFAINVL